MLFTPSRSPGDAACRDGLTPVAPFARARLMPGVMMVAAALVWLLVLAPASAPAQTDPSTAPTEASQAQAVPSQTPPSQGAAAAGATPAPSAPVATAAATPAPVPPNDLNDVGAWLDYKLAAHLSMLPDEARLFYRRGLIAKRGGRGQDAMRLVRGAADLDPTFVQPQLTLATWTLLSDPGQSVSRYAAVLELVRNSFPLQIELVGNALFFVLQGLFIGLLATALTMVFLRHAELRHIWEERLRTKVGPLSTRIWAWVILLVPFAAGLGLALPVVAFLGLLWPVLRVRERTVYVVLLVTLIAAPFSGHLIGRLAAPLSEEQAPLFGTASIRDEAWSRARQASLERLAAAHPDDPFVLFGLGWSARQGGDLATAERAYRGALVAWPEDPRVLNNLANVVVAQGRLGPAIELYRRAIAADPRCAAAQFNLSQIYTRQFEFRAASEAAARASALDFDLVKTQQTLGTGDGVLPLADLWIPPITFWRSVWEPAALLHTQPILPMVWRNHIETSGAPFAGLVLAFCLASLMVGVRWHRVMPLRTCGNCDRVVCRRCAERRREVALCPTCASQVANAETREFAQVLLARQRGRMDRSRRLVRTSLATLLPGYGLLAFQRVFRGTFLITCAALLAAPCLGVAPAFSYQSGLGIAQDLVSPILALGAWVLLYALSLLGFLSQKSRAAAQAALMAAPVRSRPSQVAHTTAKAA
jgi:tetratricopeptide (TPR) repeat protein